jgi:hypothetical protein
MHDVYGTVQRKRTRSKIRSNEKEGIEDSGTS